MPSGNDSVRSSSRRRPSRGDADTDDVPRRPSPHRRTDFTGTVSISSDPSTVSTADLERHKRRAAAERRRQSRSSRLSGHPEEPRQRSRSRPRQPQQRPSPSLAEYLDDNADDNRSGRSSVRRGGNRRGSGSRRSVPHEDDAEDQGSVRSRHRRRRSGTSQIDDETSSLLRQMVETQNAIVSTLQGDSANVSIDSSYRGRSGSSHSHGSYHERSNSIHSTGNDVVSASAPVGGFAPMPNFSPTTGASDDQLQQLSMQNQALMEHIKQLQEQMPVPLGENSRRGSFHSAGSRSTPAYANSPHASPRNTPRYDVPKSPRSDGFSLVPPPPLADSASVGSGSRRSATYQVPLSAPQGRRPTLASGSLRGPRRSASLVDNNDDAPLSAPQGARPKVATNHPFPRQDGIQFHTMPEGAPVQLPFPPMPTIDDLNNSGHDRSYKSVPVHTSAQRPRRSVAGGGSNSVARSAHSRMGVSSGREPQQPSSLGRSGHSRRSHPVDEESIHVPHSIVLDPQSNEVFSSNRHGEVVDDRSLLSGDESRGSTLQTRQDRSVGVTTYTGYTTRRSVGMTVDDTVRSAPKPKKQYNDPINEYERVDEPPGSRFWKSLSVGLTCLIPDCVIPKEGAGAKLAWREKVTICIIVFFISLAIVGGIGFMPIFLCKSSDYYTQEEINKQSNEAWITVFGTIYDVKNYVNRHPGGAQGIRDFLGQDASALFPRLPPSQLPSFCLDINKVSSLDSELSCPQIHGLDELRGVPCHTQAVGREGVHSFLGDEKKGELVIAPWSLGTELNVKNEMQYIVVDDTVYNVTQYIDGLRDEKTRVIDQEPSNKNAYLFEQLHLLIVNKLNEDATALYDDFFSTNDYKNCLDMMFYHAQVDRRHDQICASIGIAMYFLLFVVTFMMLVQVFCSLLYLARRHPHFTDEDKKAAVMIMVPCYNETDKELLKTIDSVLQNDYPEENKILVVVADGVITGAGATASTPAILGKILGFDFDCMDEAYEYKSLGKVTKNYISVYSGVYEKKVGNQTKRLKYMVMVKQGAMNERGKSRAGNRGKRDSQLVITGMLNRLHYNREPTEFDEVVKTQLDMLDIPLKDIEYMMAIDADTRVHHMAMPHMIYSLEHNKNILACCGETQVDNKAQSWVTMIQVFEYFSSHHMKKAFESVFGCVTCLPGCFTMYRLFTEDMNPLISSDIIFQEYSRNDISSLHEKNLYELGEDRMLTTLLLQHFPGMRLNFVPEAICWTIVPHTFSILLSQRRRWINSTLHNMFELLKVETMCGICCVSMKTIVIADLLATLILPASIAYLGYLTYLFTTKPETINPFVLYFYAATVALMMLPFLIRSRWDYMFWFVMYVLLGIPTFYFILPLYSFIHMDDFSWGKTRMVSGGDKKPEETPDDPEAADTPVQKTEDKGSEKDSSEEVEETERLRPSEANAKSKELGKVVAELVSEAPTEAKVVPSRRPSNAVQVMTIGTDSGEILVYFQSSRKYKQPYLAPLIEVLEISDDLRDEYGIDAILTRSDPADRTMPLRADPDDPDEDEVWFVLIRRVRSLHENGSPFRAKYAESICRLFEKLSGRHMKRNCSFVFGGDATPAGGPVPLGEYVTVSDTVAYIRAANPSTTLEALVIDRDTLELYFGEGLVTEAKDAILNEMNRREGLPRDGGEEIMEDTEMLSVGSRVSLTSS